MADRRRLILAAAMLAALAAWPLAGCGSNGTTIPGTGTPGTGDPGTGNPGTGDPGTGDPGTGDPATAGPGAAVAGVTPLDDGSPTAAEQEMLELVNRARRNPTAEAQSYGIALNEGLAPGTIDPAPKQPLAMNPILLTLARAHSDDMLDNDYFEHENSQGLDPFERMTAAGYNYTAAAENLSFQGTTGQLVLEQTVEPMHRGLFVDEGIAGRGHRRNMLNERVRELGVGIRGGVFTRDGTDFNASMHTGDFGARTSPSRFVMGVVYTDANANGRYDAGEGVPGATVRLGGAPWVTRSVGAYTYAVAPGSYTLTVEQTALGIGDATPLSVGAESVKVDYETGSGFIVR